MNNRKLITSISPQAIAAILEILNAGNDAKVTIGKNGVTVNEVSTKRKYAENAVVSGQR